MPVTALSRALSRYWWVPILIAWGGLALLLLRRDLYGLDEGAARALLLNWTIVDNVVNPIVVFGVPDFRALLFIPLGIYWSGSLLAAKVFTLLITFGAAALLYQWSMRVLSKEVALIATGLLLIAPVTLLQIDGLGAGPYLLLMFAAGQWLDYGYRTFNRPLGGRFFLQLLLVATTVTLHPAGLAYPLALLWRWYQDPLDKRQQRHVYIGVVAAVTFAALLRAGWHGLEWWANPLESLTSAVLGPRLEGGTDAALLAGVAVALLLVTVLIAQRRALMHDLMGGLLLGGVLLGAMNADLAWAMLALAALLYYGVPLLIRVNEGLRRRSLLGQRGIVMAALILVATLFMNVDKSYYGYVNSGVLAPTDQLIHTLALEAADAERPFRAASQWPGRTMIAVKRDVLPLPPAASNGDALLKRLGNVTHLLFDPYDPANQALAANIAELAGRAQTLALQPSGVIVKLRAP